MIHSNIFSSGISSVSYRDRFRYFTSCCLEISQTMILQKKCMDWMHPLVIPLEIYRGFYTSVDSCKNLSENIPRNSDRNAFGDFSENFFKYSSTNSFRKFIVFFSPKISRVYTRFLICTDLFLHGRAKKKKSAFSNSYFCMIYREIMLFFYTVF